ncbi:hypothetical protein PZA22_19960 [Pectobacterium polaris]|uniref:hypothetical protein n=1 Tax=Pectobacterium polaris TaxID=2042057 RepID=UPI0023B09586|nr:hypothetical protein [Pectobacterium polaris]MDE8756761.1 hypothetical protein [Pectobacterium polaris]
MRLSRDHPPPASPDYRLDLQSPLHKTIPGHAWWTYRCSVQTLLIHHPLHLHLAADVQSDIRPTSKLRVSGMTKAGPEWPTAATLSG